MTDLTKPKPREENGIVIFDNPLKVNLLDFDYEHLDCASIIKDISEGDDDTAEVFCYSTSEAYNRTLRIKYDSEYQDKGLDYHGGIGSFMLNGIMI